MADNFITYNYYQDIWNRFRKNKLALIGLVFILIMTLSAIFVPLFSKYDYSSQNLDLANTTPILKIEKDIYIYVQKDFNVYKLSENRKIETLLEPIESDIEKRFQKYEVDGEILILDFENKERPNGAKFSLYWESDISTELNNYSARWNKLNLWGTDNLGRDLLVRIMFGARISLFIALMASLLSLFIGVTYGGVSGYFGGSVDNIMMRIVDTISSIPFIIYVVLIMVLVESVNLEKSEFIHKLNDNGFKAFTDFLMTFKSLIAIIIAMGITYWINMARIVRGQSLQLQKREFILAAKAMGYGNRRIIFKHLLPNTIGPIIVTLAMMIPSAIFTEAFLSFIGIGLKAPLASWGTLISDSLPGIRSYGYQLILPSIAISLTMLAFNFVGDGLRDALDPRHK